MAEVQWFLVDLFFLGYVEDPSSGLSFKMPSKLKWECYFEVIVLWFCRLVLLAYPLGIAQLKLIRTLAIQGIAYVFHYHSADQLFSDLLTFNVNPLAPWFTF